MSMKKIFIVLFLLAVMNAGAQNFQLGVKGGVNMSNFTGGDFGDVEKKALVGFHVGGFTRFLFGKNLALQPEVLFSSQGAKLEDATDEQNIKINYVNIPIMLQFITDGGFYLEAGPQFGFKVSEDVPDMPVDDYAKSTDVALALGLGLQSPTASMRHSRTAGHRFPAR